MTTGQAQKLTNLLPSWNDPNQTKYPLPPTSTDSIINCQVCYEQKYIIWNALLQVGSLQSAWNQAASKTIASNAQLRPPPANKKVETYCKSRLVCVNVYRRAVVPCQCWKSWILFSGWIRADESSRRGSLVIVNFRRRLLDSKKSNEVSWLRVATVTVFWRLLPT